MLNLVARFSNGVKRKLRENKKACMKIISLDAFQRFV
jgi:hypothetical protein